jgi:hypothetical protein
MLIDHWIVTHQRDRALDLGQRFIELPGLKERPPKAIDIVSVVGLGDSLPGQ